MKICCFLVLVIATAVCNAIITVATGNALMGSVGACCVCASYIAGRLYNSMD